MAPVVPDHDIAIVGYGPVGSVLASLLGRRGLNVVVFDEHTEVFPLPRAAHIDHQGLRTLQEVGCLDELLPQMLTNPGMDLVTADLDVLIRIPGDSLSASGLPSSMYFHQPGFDRAIRTAAESLPNVTTHLGATVVSVDQTEERVSVQAVRPGDPDIVVTARWVIGCDGARSTIRRLQDIELDSLGFEENWLVVDIALREPVRSLPDRALQVCDPSRPMTVLPMPGTRYRFELMLMPGEIPEEMQEFESVKRLLATWIPLDLVDVERCAVYTFHGLIAEKWRSGRVLIAGDAAHQMPPFLGQGMCSGIRDATNLAWKLDHVLRGRGPDSLLDSYQAEREPHVRSIIEAAVWFGRIICITDPRAAADRDKRLLADSTPIENRRPFGLPDLEPGGLVAPGGGELFLQPEPVGNHPRLDDYVGQRFLVLARTEEALGVSGRWWSAEIGALVTRLEDVPDPTGSVRNWFDERDVDVVVVRPDRYVLGTGSSLDSITNRVRHLLVDNR